MARLREYVTVSIDEIRVLTSQALRLLALLRANATQGEYRGSLTQLYRGSGVNPHGKTYSAVDELIRAGLLETRYESNLVTRFKILTPLALIEPPKVKKAIRKVRHIRGYEAPVDAFTVPATELIGSRKKP